jgi:hypothetical protein
MRGVGDGLESCEGDVEVRRDARARGCRGEFGLEEATVQVVTWRGSFDCFLDEIPLCYAPDALLRLF